MNKTKKPRNLGGYIHVDRKTLEEIDYLDKLSPSELEWYNKFIDETYNGVFKNDGTDLIIEKSERRKIWREKKLREYSIDNKLFSTASSEPGTTILKPLDKNKRKIKKNNRIKT